MNECMKWSKRSSFNVFDTAAQTLEDSLNKTFTESVIHLTKFLFSNYYVSTRHNDLKTQNTANAKFCKHADKWPRCKDPMNDLSATHGRTSKCVEKLLLILQTVLTDDIITRHHLNWSLEDYQYVIQRSLKYTFHLAFDCFYTRSFRVLDIHISFYKIRNYFGTLKILNTSSRGFHFNRKLFSCISNLYHECFQTFYPHFKLWFWQRFVHLFYD